MKLGGNMTWLYFALSTAACWGLYGIFLHSGQIAMNDPVNGRYKAFLIVGIAYLIVGVFGSMFVMYLNGSDWSFTSKGITHSIIAGTLGAFGAFFVLLAFGAKGTPAVVMSLIFGLAPVVNGVVATILHPPEGGFANMRWQFYAGILLAALGGFLVSYYKPTPAKKAPVQVTETPSTQTP